MNNMYSKLPNIVIGFHGCDITTYEQVLMEHKLLNKSTNSYDWLGNGVYFWENSYERALDWAKKNKKIKTPAVIGAIIDLGHCLNLTDYKSSEILMRGYEMLKLRNERLQIPLPENKNIKGNDDLLVRDLDCAVIQQIHEYHASEKLTPFDSVRGVFIEGKEIYPGSGFRDKTHIQICVVNPNCIKGYFKPIKVNEEYNIP